MGNEPPDGEPPHEQAQDREWIAGEIAAGVRGLNAEDVPAGLCRIATRLLPVTGASMSVVGTRAHNRVTLCSSDPVASRLAEVQYTVGDCPSRQAVELHAPVFADDLTKGRDLRRWPVFAQQAVEAGARAVFSLPLGQGAHTVGTLDLYRDSPGVLSERQARLALLTADAAGLAVLTMNDRYPPGANGDVPWLEKAEGSREEVH